MIETERLILRRWKPSDSEPYANLNSDPQVMEFLLKPLTREESDAMIARMESHFAEHGFGLWAVEVKSTGEFIGSTGLMRPSFEAPFTPCVEVGWRLARSSWGKGFATEAALGAVTFGFEKAGLKEILSFTVPANRRSIAVMERIGMRRDPIKDFEHPRVPEGHALRKHVLYRLNRDDVPMHRSPKEI
jgi:ribosomal-protein-alanine N-acetyltransferase